MRQAARTRAEESECFVEIIFLNVREYWNTLIVHLLVSAEHH